LIVYAGQHCSWLSLYEHEQRHSSSNNNNNNNNNSGSSSSFMTSQTPTIRKQSSRAGVSLSLGLLVIFFADASHSVALVGAGF
jgi:hypothetical protein